VSKNRGLRGSRRPGISNLVGAIFFVLIVALSIATLTVMFIGSSAYIGGIHTTNQQALQGINSNITVSDVAFGGALTKGTFADASGPGIPVNWSLPANPTSVVPGQLPLLPVTNMNFTSGIQGWSVSKSYPALVDGATVSNALLSNGSSYIEQAPVGSYPGLSATQSANAEVFVFSVTNNALGGSGDFVAKISILVDTYFNGVSHVTCSSPSCSGWNAPVVTGNNITLTAIPIAALPPGQTATWQWTADVPQTAGNYYHTVVVYWVNNVLPYRDYGIATVGTTIATPLPFPNPPAPTEKMVPRTAGVSPGGLIAGYDSNAISCTSSSGPGCIYVNFEPNFGGQSLPAGQQLSAGAAFTTTFSLTQAQVCQLRATLPAPCTQVCPSDCFMGASVSTSLDEVSSVPNSLVYYHLILVNPSGGSFTINPGGSDPTTLNHFASTGWNEQNIQLPTTGAAAPPVSFWTPGTYRFELVVNMTMPSGQPSEISVHFDDVGLALNLLTPPGGLGGSAFGSGVLTLPTFPGLASGGAAGYNQVEQLDIAVNMSLSSFPPQTLGNTEAYVYAARVPAPVLNAQAPASWYEVGAVTFNGSATANVVIPLPQATSFVNRAGQLSIKIDTVTVGAGTACPSIRGSCTLSASAYAVAQTENTAQAVGQAVLTISNSEGASAVHLVSVFFSGPNGTLPFQSAPATPNIGASNGLMTFPIDNWVNPGSTLTICRVFGSAATPSLSCPAVAPLPNFEWIPGQVYQVTVYTAQGVAYSGSFTAP
jgi:hypothetical protein